MQTKILVDTAVMNSSTTGSKAWADKLFAHWFNRLVYAQIWEDPQADLDALQLQPGANILTISSGGCNALAYLSSAPAAVHAVDVNNTHLAMLAMKKTALQHLPGYADVLAYLGAADQSANRQRYEQYLRSHLDQQAAAFWESKEFNGSPRYLYFTRNAYAQGLLGHFIALAHHFVKFLGGDMRKMLEASSLEEQQTLFARYVAPAFDSAIFRFLANQPVALYSLGIPPAQYHALKADAATGMHELFKERMRHLACDFPLRENCFAMQAFARRYDIQHQAGLPLYLQQQHYQTIRQYLPRLHAHHCTLTQFLQTRPPASVDAYLFLDAQDWMDQQQLNELWTQVNRTAAPDAKVVFRTGGKQSPLETLLPQQILNGWYTDPGHNQKLYRADRSAIYGGMHLYHKRPN
jgi:S-adenosylmethionine-diacylglycerol 3-amino-3-carboxypropyl transferase